MYKVVKTAEEANSFSYELVEELKRVANDFKQDGEAKITIINGDFNKNIINSFITFTKASLILKYDLNTTEVHFVAVINEETENADFIVVMICNEDDKERVYNKVDDLFSD